MFFCGRLTKACLRIRNNVLAQIQIKNSSLPLQIIFGRSRTGALRGGWVPQSPFSPGRNRPGLHRTRQHRFGPVCDRPNASRPVSSRQNRHQWAACGGFINQVRSQGEGHGAMAPPRAIQFTLDKMGFCPTLTLRLWTLNVKNRVLNISESRNCDVASSCATSWQCICHQFILYCISYWQCICLVASPYTYVCMTQ